MPKCTTGYIYYYPGKKGKPLDLKKEINKRAESGSISKVLEKYVEKRKSSLTSTIYFTSDTCRISPNGVIPDARIMFGGYIGNNKVGALLPHDYEPEE
ncbi:hypothetical protein LJB91_03255 [Bacteroidales bacterium OttesenSCG-928-L03]|nr:hypothetical protein [Bacteroidales bacterium OttesenSCG-928-L03]